MWSGNFRRLQENESERELASRGLLPILPGFQILRSEITAFDPLAHDVSKADKVSHIVVSIYLQVMNGYGETSKTSLLHEFREESEISGSRIAIHDGVGKFSLPGQCRT